MRSLNRIVIFIALLCAPALATDIEGVQPAALDQPRVNVHLRRTVNGPALSADEKAKGADLGKALGIDLGPASTINIEAFLDTGASGVMISRTTAAALGVAHANATPAGKDTPEPVLFHDVGVGGSDVFHVSEPLVVFLAGWNSGNEPDDAEGYPLHTGQLRAQVGPMGSSVLDLLTGGLDVVGMPAMQGRIVVIDPKPVDTFADTLRTRLFDAGEAKKPQRGPNGIPETDRHIRLSYVSFKNYTRTDPPAGPGPTLAPNPFIGPPPAPDASAQAAKAIPPVSASFGGKSRSGSWLLDTGAAASMISEKQAAALGVTYVAATKNTAAPRLAGVPEKDQFTLAIGGVGGQHTAAGFFLDELVIPTVENDPLVYKRAPVLVQDITVTDAATNRSITLDGVFGMNYLVATAHVTGGLLPDLGELTAGPFEWIVFDQPKGILAVKLKKQ